MLSPGSETRQATQSGHFILCISRYCRTAVIDSVAAGPRYGACRVKEKGFYEALGRRIEQLSAQPKILEPESAWRGAVAFPDARGDLEHRIETAKQQRACSRTSQSHELARALEVGLQDLVERQQTPQVTEASALKRTSPEGVAARGSGGYLHLLKKSTSSSDSLRSGERLRSETRGHRANYMAVTVLDGPDRDGAGARSTTSPTG